ncbi:MAG: hypothetical protein U9N31_10355, partial [Candidatus Marinimicrobia bacterium]|nr:hypothetical protein [Candidatus Neomarinimicrobiota bacterium]
MIFYRQIAVIVLFFLILILFIYPNQSGILFLLLKGITVGGLVIVFISFAFPQVFRPNQDHLEEYSQSVINANKPSFSSTVKDHYNKLLLQILNLVMDINPEFSAAIYMIDPENKGYTCQEKSIDDFQDFIEDGNDIIAPILKKSNPTINRKSDKNPGWDGIMSTQTWRGSETLMGFPILYAGNTVGCLLIYVDHF